MLKMPKCYRQHNSAGRQGETLRIDVLLTPSLVSAGFNKQFPLRGELKRGD